MGVGGDCADEQQMDKVVVVRLEERIGSRRFRG